MKKLLLSTTAFLSMFATVSAQNILPCNTYGARETYLKTVPGYAAKLNAAEAASAAEYQAFLQNSNAAAKTMTVDPTYTVPVVFHILHLGEAPGFGSNIDDQLCIDALAQVNRDYARQGADTATIDVLFEPLYQNAHMQFMLARKDPYGNCTNGIVHHFNPKTDWSQADIFNYQYSTYATGNWNPSKYLNIYIVKDIIGSSIGIIVGYTHLPGTEPVSSADAIVYRNDFLSGLDGRSLSHEIGHWFGLSHTFGSTNEPELECSNDDISDTPKTTGFFSNCPKAANYPVVPSVAIPVDGSDIVSVKLESSTTSSKLLSSTSPLNSLNSYLIKPITSLTGTITTYDADTLNVKATGVAGGYADYSRFYGNDFIAGSTATISIRSLASSTVANNVAVYFDFNRNGNFTDFGEDAFFPSDTVINYNLVPLNKFGSYSFNWKAQKINTVVAGVPTTPDSFIVVPSTIVIPGGARGPVRMRVITSDLPITGPTMTLNSGEIEDYNLNIGLPSCDTVRPNIENIMDYSSCPKMFTKGQNAKVRQSAVSMIGNRALLISDANLYFTGILGTKTFTTITTTTVPVTSYTTYIYSNPTTVTPCSPIADFASNKLLTCASQAVTYNSTSYNSVPTSYLWTFEGGSPATSTLATQSVTYAAPGSYSVSLTVSNADGTNTKSVANYFVAKWNSAQIPLPYSQNFEASQSLPAGWNVINPDFDTPQWEMSNAYGAGTLSNQYHSLVLGNANQTSNFFPGFAGNVDIIETPAFDFSNTTGISISFDYSFARKTGVTTDDFYLQYSKDCSGSWSAPIPGVSASIMAASGGVVNAPYIPLSSATTSTTANPKWLTKNIVPGLLTALNNQRDVKFRFYFVNDENGQSQNLYIDNVNVSGTVGIHEFENSLGLSIYPNPTSSSATIELTSPKDTKVAILVYDVTGRIVEENTVNAAAGVNSKYSVNTANRLKAGIYFITIVIDNNKITKKLIID